MSIKKRLAALACATIMAASLVSCGKDTMHICSTENYDVNAGVYIYFVLNEVNNQMYSIYYSTGELPDDIVGASYGDGTLTVGEHSEQLAYANCVEMVAVAEKFKELELEFSEEEKKTIEEAVEKAWNAEYYESLGVAKSSLTQIQEFSVMNDAVFGAYYFEGGIEEVTKEDINKHLADDYLCFKMISISKGAEGKDKDEANKRAKEYLALTEEMEFDEVIAKFEADEEAKKKEENKDNTSSEADDKDKDEEEKDNRLVINKTGANMAALDVVKFIDEKMKDGDIKTFEDDDSWYVLQKLDPTKHETYADDNKKTLISEMKSADFEKMVDSWVESCNVTKNEKAYKRYSAEDIYEKYEEYLEKNK